MLGAGVGMQVSAKSAYNDEVAGWNAQQSSPRGNGDLSRPTYKPGSKIGNTSMAGSVLIGCGAAVVVTGVAWTLYDHFSSDSAPRKAVVVPSAGTNSVGLAVDLRF